MNIIILHFEAHCAIAPIPLPGNYRKLLQRRSNHPAILFVGPHWYPRAARKILRFQAHREIRRRVLFAMPVSERSRTELLFGGQLLLIGHQRYYHFKGNTLSTSGNKYYTTANVLYLMIRFINEWDNYETFISKSTIINFWQINVNFRFGEKFVFYRLKFRSKML